MYRLVLSLLLVSHVIMGSEDTKKEPEAKSQEQGDPDLGLEEKWTLTNENAEKIQKEVPNFIVFVYVNWCGHCKSFAPTWKTVADELNSDPASKTKVFSANVEKNSEIHNGKDITTFPTIFYVRKGEWIRFAAERNKKNVMEFVKDLESDPTIEITSEELEEYLSVSDVSVVGKFSSEEDSVKFDTLAWKMRLPSAAILRDDTQPDGITVHSNLEGKPHRMTTRDLDWEKVDDFIAKARRPLVIPFSRDNHLMVFEIKNLTAHVLLFHDKDNGSEARLDTLRKVSRTYGHSFTFVEMEMSNQYVKRYSSFFKIKSEDLPIVYVIDTNAEKETKGQMSTTKDLTEKGISQLIEDYTKGESEMVEPSGEPKRGAEEEKDELPDDWEDRHVKYLTGANYKDYVLNPEHDVFLMIYRDSCPHCQKIEPTWEEMGELYEWHVSIKMAQMKAQHVKDIPGLEIEYVPTLIFYPKQITDIADGIPYMGQDRSKEELEKFIMKVRYSYMQQNQSQHTEVDDDDDEDDDEDDFDLEDEDDEDETDDNIDEKSDRKDEL